jgi:threonine dehydratase
VEPSPGLSERIGPTTLKLEHLQVTGSFKVRGALFALSRLPPGTGVATCSAGNHGKGVAYAARRLGLQATVYVPASVDAAKLRGMQDLGATVIRSEHAGFDDTEPWAMEEARRKGLTWVSAFEDDAVMAGNGGSLALEVLEQVPDLTRIVIPLGGGGLAAGVCAGMPERMRVIGVQHERSPAFRLSQVRGEAVTRLPAADTLAGGIEGGIGRRNYALIRDRVEVVEVDEAAIHDAVRWLVDAHQTLVEPTGAVAVAAARTTLGADEHTVVVLTGRNVAYATVAALLR